MARQKKLSQVRDKGLCGQSATVDTGIPRRMYEHLRQLLQYMSCRLVEKLACRALELDMVDDKPSCICAESNADRGNVT
jgi:hypothetical protein